MENESKQNIKETSLKTHSYRRSRFEEDDLIEMTEYKLTIENTKNSKLDDDVSLNVFENKREFNDQNNFNTDTDPLGFDYEKQTALEKNFYRFIDFMKFFPMIIGIVFYLISLKGCHKAFFVCVMTFERKMLYEFIIPCVIVASFAFFFQFSIIKYLVEKSNDKRTKLLYLIPIIAIIILFIIDRGTAFDKHGFFNILFLFIFTSLFFMVEKILRCLYFLFQKHKTTLFSGIIFCCILIYLFNRITKKTFDDSCMDWTKGLKDSRISNEGSSCVVTKPKVCLMTMMNGWMSYSYWTNKTCETMIKGDYSAIQNVITDKNATVIGFPRTNNWSWEEDAKRKYFNHKVRKEIINMEDPLISDDIKSQIETIVDFNFSPAQVTIDLKKNTTLIKEREQRFKKKNHDILAKNILVLYIDSLSRADFRRKLPSFHSWIEKYYRSSEKESHESFQFFKYHGVGRYTLLNNVPAFWGTYSLQTEYGSFYLENYKQRGYVTGNAQNHCAKETVASDDINSIFYSNWDHELNGFFCDPNNETVNNTISNFHGANSITPRCLYGRHTGEYNMDYAMQFFRAYKDQAKIFHLGLMDNHEATAEGITLLDDKIVNFLNQFEKEGFFEDTTIIVQTDHGHAYMSLYNVVKSQDHEKELVLPAFFLIIPKKKFNNFSKLKENLYHNENAMVSPFTIYNSYQALVGYHADNVARFSDYNIFYDKIPLTTNCTQFWDEDYYSIAEHLCRCEG